MRILIVTDLLYNLTPSDTFSMPAKAILESDGHDVEIISMDVGGFPGQGYNSYYNNLLPNIDVILYPSSQKIHMKASDDIISQFEENIKAIKNNARSTLQIIPVKLGVQIWLPPSLLDLYSAIIETESSSIDFKTLEPFLLNLMKKVSERSEILVQEAKDSQILIEQKAATYIDQSLKSLKKREFNFTGGAIIGYTLGYICLILAICTAIHYTSSYLDNKILATKNIWPILIYFCLRGFAIIGLLVAASRYAFIIAQSSMNEALRNADRTHAISFGKFYITAYPDKVDWDQLKEAFQYWNINNTPGFGTPGATDYDKVDPKLLETICAVVSTINKK